MSSLKPLDLKPLTGSKLPNVLLKGALRFKQIKCDSALNGAEQNLEGGGGADFVFFDENSTATGATMTIDDESSTAAMPIGPLRGFRDLECKRIFITCAAQAGKVLNLWYGRGVYIYGAQPVGKGQWYDRNPLEVALNYLTSAVAPHALTTRFTYTVPAGRKCNLQQASAFICRDAVATGDFAVRGRINYTGALGPSAVLAFCQFILRNLNTQGQQGLAGAMICLAGDVVNGQTSDASADGSVLYALSIQGTEFDA